MNLYMVRHGQTAASRDNRFSGSSDPPLTAVGEAMAQAFAAAYASLTWDGIYTSPMLRTRQTADALCRLTGVQAIVEDGLKEVDYGEWEGLKQNEVKKRWPEAFEYWADDVASRGTPGGETAFHVAARAMRVVEEIRSRHGVPVLSLQFHSRRLHHHLSLLFENVADLWTASRRLQHFSTDLFGSRFEQPNATPDNARPQASSPNQKQAKSRSIPGRGGEPGISSNRSAGKILVFGSP